MFDAIIFEKLGVPAVPIITAPFAPTATAIAKMHGFEDYRWAVVDHPITSLNEDQLLERAKVAAPQVAAALVSPQPPVG